MKTENINRGSVLIFSCIAMACLGVAYTWTVFTGPLAERFNDILSVTTYTADDFSVAFTVYSAVSIVSMIFGGALNDKIGPRWVMLLGGALLFVGFFICSIAKSIAVVVLGFGVIVCLGIATAYSCVLSNVVRFFPDRKGLVSGLATASFGTGTVILSPVANALLERSGASFTFRLLGAVLALIVIGCSFFVKRCPEKYMYMETGKTAGTSTGRDMNWKQMLRDKVFYIMVLIFASGSFFGIMVTAEASPIAVDRIGFSSAVAAATVSAISISSVGGRLICGAVSDKLGRINTITGVLIIAAVGLIALLCSSPGSGMVFVVAMCMLGFSYGSFMSVYPGFCAERFGIANNGTNYGVMFIGFSGAGALAPSITAAVHKATGVYDTAFVVALIVAAAGLALTVIYRIADRKTI